MNFDGIQVVLNYIQLIFNSLPSQLYRFYQLIFWIFIVLSVVKVLSWKEGGN